MNTELLELNLRKEVLERVLNYFKIEDLDEVIEDALLCYYDVKIQELKVKNFGNYVYAFLNPELPGITVNGFTFCNEPFYIGKGSDKRIENDFRNEEVNKLISELNGKHLKVIIKDGLSNLQSYKLETYLINFIGRKDLSLGPLLNKTIIEKFKNFEDGFCSLPCTGLNIELHSIIAILKALNSSETIKKASIKLGISERTLYRNMNSLKIVYKNGYYYQK